MDTNNDWTDAKGLALHMDVSVPTIRRMTQEKKIPSHRVGARLLRYSIKEVDEAIRNGGSDDKDPKGS